MTTLQHLSQNRPSFSGVMFSHFAGQGVLIFGCLMAANFSNIWYIPWNEDFDSLLEVQKMHFLIKEFGFEIF